jgi:small subunit ribosomal protein S17
MTESNQQQSQKRDVVGEVVSNSMTKTIVVAVGRRIRHPRYKKIITRIKKYYAHDENGDAGLGDVVRIQETRPLSRLKRWRLTEVVRKSKQAGGIAS